MENEEKRLCNGRHIGEHCQRGRGRRQFVARERDERHAGRDARRCAAGVVDRQDRRGNLFAFRRTGARALGARRERASGNAGLFRRRRRNLVRDRAARRDERGGALARGEHERGGGRRRLRDKVVRRARDAERRHVGRDALPWRLRHHRHRRGHESRHARERRRAADGLLQRQAERIVHEVPEAEWRRRGGHRGNLSCVPGALHLQQPGLCARQPVQCRWDRLLPSAKHRWNLGLLPRLDRYGGSVRVRRKGLSGWRLHGHGRHVGYARHAFDRVPDYGGARREGRTVLLRPRDGRRYLQAFRRRLHRRGRSLHEPTGRGGSARGRRVSASEMGQSCAVCAVHCQDRIRRRGAGFGRGERHDRADPRDGRWHVREGRRGDGLARWARLRYGRCGGGARGRRRRVHRSGRSRRGGACGGRLRKGRRGR